MRKNVYIIATVAFFLIFSLCLTIGINNEKVYTPRLTAPLYSNKCFYADNIFYKSGYGMPNCTAYAWGRAYEILGHKPNLSLSNAGKWYEYNRENKIYSYGQKAKVGAIICFDNKDGGHVAVVEKIENGIITFSNSAYGGTNFYLSTAKLNSKNIGQKNWIFQGYIYLKDNLQEEFYLNSIRKVKSKNGLNFRDNIGLNSQVIKVIPPDAELFITKVYYLDGYKWGETYYQGKKGYCVINYTKGV